MEKFPLVSGSHLEGSATGALVVVGGTVVVCSPHCRQGGLGHSPGRYTLSPRMLTCLVYTPLEYSPICNGRGNGEGRGCEVMQRSIYRSLTSNVSPKHTTDIKMR